MMNELDTIVSHHDEYGIAIKSWSKDTCMDVIWDSGKVLVTGTTITIVCKYSELAAELFLSENLNAKYLKIKEGTHK